MNVTVDKIEPNCCPISHSIEISPQLDVLFRYEAPPALQFWKFVAAFAFSEV